MWGRQSYRWSPMDFEANAKDGVGVDWPVRYDEIAPWYDYVESFIGVSGRAEGIAAAARRQVPAADGAQLRRDSTCSRRIADKFERKLTSAASRT